MDNSEMFAQLVEQEHGRLVGWLTRQLGDRHDAEDVAQNAWLKLWEHKDKGYRWTARLAYLSARQRLYEHYRHRRLATVPLDEFHSVADSRDVLAEIENRIAVESLLSMMTERERTVAILYSRGHSYGRIAVILGIPEGTAKSRIQWAKSAAYRTVRPSGKHRAV